MWDYPTPTLLSVSGCSGSGAVTYDCVPDTAVLVFTGVNLTALAVPSNIRTSTQGGGSSTVNFQYNNPLYSNNTVNDTCIVLALSGVYQYIVRDVHYNGTVQVDFVYLNRFYSTPVFVNFVALPPPQVLALLGRSCGNNSLTSSFRTFDCVGGYSQLVLTGHYYYAPFSIFVGGLDCYMQGQGSTWFQPRYASCLLPPLPGGWYDLNVTNAGGSVILPQAVGVSFAPSVSAVTSAQCAVDVQSTTTQPRMKCVGGETVTLTGVNFRTDVDSFAVLLSNPFNASQQLNCSQPALLNSTRLTCVLPVPPASYFGLDTFLGNGYVQVQVVYDDLQTSNAYLLYLYDSLSSPVFSSLSAPGCSLPSIDPATGLSPTYAGCYATNGALVTVAGVRFNPLGMNMQSPLGIYCNPVGPINVTAFICRLGGISNSPETLATAYPFYLVTTAGSWLTSHLFYLRFALPPAPNTGDGTATEGGGEGGRKVSGGVVAAMVVCSLVAVVVVAGVA